MTAAVHPPRHQVSRAVAAIHALLDRVQEASTWSMPAEEAAATLAEVTRLVARTAELKLRVAAHAEQLDVGSDAGATSTASWWAHATGQTRTETHRRTRLGVALAEHYPRVRGALAAGGLILDQASVIVAALEALPTHLDPETVARAEAVLVAEARHLDAKALRILGRRILDVIAPEVGEAHQAKLLDREEARAAATCRLTMTEDGHGRVHGRFTLPAVQAAMLKKTLLALAAPKHQTATNGDPAGARGVRRPGPERMGRALGEYIERYPTQKLPHAGGVAATVVVTLDLATLTGALAAAHLDTGETISPGQARRLACEAGIIPAVLGGDSLVLDLGRKRRFHSPAQRLAIALRDKTCIVEGCDRGIKDAHFHHLDQWSQGGNTSVERGAMICGAHHTQIHDPRYATESQPGGKVRFLRRT